MTEEKIPVVVVVISSTCQMCLTRRGPKGLCSHCDAVPNCSPGCKRCKNASVYDGVGPRR